MKPKADISTDEMVELVAIKMSDLAKNHSEWRNWPGTLSFARTAVHAMCEYIDFGPRKIRRGDRVQANQSAGFHKGAIGTVEFVEPTYTKVWVLRDGASTPVFYHPNELDVYQ